MAHAFAKAGLLMLAGAQAGDVADRSMHNGFLSQYVGSDASKTSVGDYNKFMTPQFSRMKHGGAADALSQQDFNPSKIAKEQEEKSVQKLLTSENSMPIGTSAIAVSLLSLAAMLGVRMRRGLQQATDMSIALAPASADNILELKAVESTVRGEVGWSQQSSENSRPLTVGYAGPSAAADFTDVQSLPGILEPTGFFDPLSLSEGASPSELKRYREAELTHGRVAMLASVGFLVGESGATPLFGGKIDGIAINQFWQVPKELWPIVLFLLAVPEVFRALRGWMDPSVPENYFQLRPEYIPGDLDFDPAGLKPEDPEEFKEMQTKELQHCRLAMLAAAGMIVQELQTGATLFYVSPLAPASADNILEVKAQESF